MGPHGGASHTAVDLAVIGVNLEGHSHVKQPRLLEDESIVFLLKDGKEVVFSRRQSVLFRKIRGL